MHFNIPLRQWTSHASLISWVEEMIALCQPKQVYLCEGGQEEFDRLAAERVAAGTLTPLNPQKRPHSFWCHSHPDDVARVEECTFICSKRKEDAGPTNNWADPEGMHQKLKRLFRGCMQGRTMYVVPYCMGPLGSPFSRVGMEITDSSYVVLNLYLMTRMGKEALQELQNGSFIPGMHSVGMPLQPGQRDVPWPCNPKERCIAHFPEERSIWSFGSGYGGNALLGKKCFALRIASVLGREEGWLAEHMLILGLTNPQGQKKYMAAAFPSACGKTNLAMLRSALAGWKVECVGDDIAWIRPGPDGRLYAINPEAGYFGVAPGTSLKTNPHALNTLKHHTLFTNVALTPDKDVWWEGMDQPAPEGLLSWLGAPWDPKSGKPAAHPNSRFTVRATQCPIYDPAAENPQGVPLSAIIFGGRRNRGMPLVFEARNWQHGTFLGASVSSETTAAAKGEVGKLRHDPFAMLPFCGYHMGDYFAHWLKMGASLTHPPKIYHVNWFLKGEEGKYLWPGYGENIRVLKWIFERCANEAQGISTPIGVLPKELDLTGLSLPQPEKILQIDLDFWKQETEELERYFQLFGEKMPNELLQELHTLRSRIQDACDSSSKK